MILAAKQDAEAKTQRYLGNLIQMLKQQGASEEAIAQQLGLSAEQGADLDLNWIQLNTGSPSSVKGSASVMRTLKIPLVWRCGLPSKTTTTHGRACFLVRASAGRLKGSARARQAFGSGRRA